MSLILNIIIFILININLILHSIGIYALINVYKNGVQTVEQLYIINLSLVELATQLLDFIRHLPNFLTFSDNASSTVQEVQYYLKIVLFTGVCPVYYLSMNYITINKLIEVILNIRYSVYWNEGKAKILLKITWCISIIVCIGFSLSYRFYKYQFEDVFYKYVYPMFNFGFIIMATFTYSFIFYQFKQTRLPPSRYNSNQRKRYSEDLKKQKSSIASRFVRRSTVTLKVFKNSRFYVSVLLILTFLVFLVIPDVVYLVYGIILKNESQILETVVQISYELSFLADGFIYIFMQPRVRNLIRRKLGFNNSRQGTINIMSGLRRSHEVAMVNNTVLNQETTFKTKMSSSV
jgi:hypothetical protein